VHEGAADPITADKDAKLLRLLKWLDDMPLLRKHKLLIFTQYADTARYLYAHLAPKLKGVEFADSHRDDLDGVVKRFAPIAKQGAKRESPWAAHSRAGCHGRSLRRAEPPRRGLHREL